MTEEFRNPSGGRIQRECPISFEFNGRRYKGFLGDTLASALIANGVSIAVSYTHLTLPTNREV